MSDDELEFGEPSDDTAEVGVLAACFQSDLACKRAEKVVAPADFYAPGRELIFTAILDLRREGKPVDPVTMNDRMRALPDHVRSSALSLLPQLVTMVVPETVDHYAEIVRGCAVRRRVINHGRTMMQQGYSPTVDPVGLVQDAIGRLTEVRDKVAPEVESFRLGDLMAEEDEPYDWIVPGLLERQDRLMVTGMEGLGKSTLLRQFGICSAAGLHPFDRDREIEPIKVHIVECENPKRTTKREIRALFAQAKLLGDDPSDRVVFDFKAGGLDLATDRDLSWLHRTLDVSKPDMLMIGPIYRMFPRALQTDDEAAPAIAALDSLRDRGLTLVLEAHSGHAKGYSGKRDPRPRGSSALLGWPEFGYGLTGSDDANVVNFVPWRGDRDRNREWPKALVCGGKFPFSIRRDHRPTMWWDRDSEGEREAS